MTQKSPPFFAGPGGAWDRLWRALIQFQFTESQPAQQGNSHFRDPEPATAEVGDE